MASRKIRRTKPLRTLTLSDKAWARLEEVARRRGHSRSGHIEWYALNVPLPPARKPPATPAAAKEPKGS